MSKNCSLLGLQDILPLTCSRSGTCCHGKIVRLNPWELKQFALAREMSAWEFRDRYCEHGGIRIRFDGKSQWMGMSACSLYQSGVGCIAHRGRPLACRLYPLGRQRQGEIIQYMFQGEKFPCLNGCPEVQDLPLLRVQDYVNGQGTQYFERAHDAYLEVMQDMADIAFVLYIESGLAASGDSSTLDKWRKMGVANPYDLVNFVGEDWIDCVMVPEIMGVEEDPLPFIEKHVEMLKAKAQREFGLINQLQAFSRASSTMMGVALYLGASLGANPKSLSERWTKAAMEIAGHG